MFKLYHASNNRDEAILDITIDEDPRERVKAYYRKHGLETANLQGVRVYDLCTRDQQIAQEILRDVRKEVQWTRDRSVRPGKGRPNLIFKQRWYNQIASRIEAKMAELGFSPVSRQGTYWGAGRRYGYY